MTALQSRLSLVVAVARNGVIGRDGDLPWRLSSDLKHFKKITMGKPIIMGRKTFDSIGRPLPGRPNFVVTRQTDWTHQGVIVCNKIESALSKADTAAADADTDEICIIGGGALYAATIDAADRLYITMVDAEIEGDVTFPSFTLGEWRKTSIGRIEKDAKNDHSCEFFVLDRRIP